MFIYIVRYTHLSPTTSTLHIHNIRNRLYTHALNNSLPETIYIQPYGVLLGSDTFYNNSVYSVSFKKQYKTQSVIF